MTRYIPAPRWIPDIPIHALTVGQRHEYSQLQEKNNHFQAHMCCYTPNEVNDPKMDVKTKGIMETKSHDALPYVMRAEA